MTAPTVHSMKSTGYGQIRVRSLTHARRLHEVLFRNDFSHLNASDENGNAKVSHGSGGIVLLRAE